MDAAPDDILSVAQLGFLHLARKRRISPSETPLLDRVLASGNEELPDRVRAALKLPQTLKTRQESTRDKVGSEAKALAEKSLQAGYMKDALKYLTVAHEADPVDFNVMLKLGWAYNILHQDREALKWFDLARKSPDPAVATEAGKAWHNLRPACSRRSEPRCGLFPFYSSRWKDVFSYAPGRRRNSERAISRPPLLSVPFRRRHARTVTPSMGLSPQYLSESSFIVGAGSLRVPGAV